MGGSRWWVAIVLFVACGPRIPPLPSRGGPAWFEVRSAHFTLWTDASAARGRELVRKMEHHRQVVLGAMNNAPSTARSFVIALRDADEVAAYVPRTFVATAWSANAPARQPGIILSADASERDRVFSHELTHVIGFGIFGNQSSWFHEGLATYFEMTALDPGATQVKIGIPREDHARFLLTRSPISMAKLFACEEDACLDHGFYATSWALFSFLINVHTDRFIDYMRRLQQAPRDKQAEVWRAVFPELSPATLDPLLKKWLVSGPIALPLIYVPAVQALPSTERPLTDADALAARGLLHLTLRRNEPAARSEVAAALALEPTHLLARLVEAAITQSIAPDVARATAAAHPSDWRAWWLLGIALPPGPEATEAHDRLCALAAHEAPECTHAAPPGPPRGASE